MNNYKRKSVSVWLLSAVAASLLSLCGLLAAGHYFGLLPFARTPVSTQIAAGNDHPKARKPVAFAISKAESVEPARSFVVVVGAGTFQDDAIDPRPTADADARALYALLTDDRYLGVPAERSRLLVSTPDDRRKEQASTRDAITQAVEAALTQTGKGDLVVGLSLDVV
jgi:hypothetical protein